MSISREEALDTLEELAVERQMESQDPERVFLKAWIRLADLGKCDGWMGAECMRVWNEWVAADFPPDVEAFIIKRANIGPDEKE